MSEERFFSRKNNLSVHIGEDMADSILNTPKTNIPKAPALFQYSTMVVTTPQRGSVSYTCVAAQGFFGQPTQASVQVSEHAREMIISYSQGLDERQMSLQKK